MRITLIYANRRTYSGNLSTHRFLGLATQHEGLLLLGQLLEAQGHDVRIFDEQITPFEPEMIDGAELVGISIQTMDSIQGFRLAAICRKRRIPVVMGGVHASLFPEATLDHCEYVVRNEGEKTLPELVAALEHKDQRLADIQGLSYWHDGQKRHNPSRPFLTTEEMDALPIPQWRKIPGWGHPILRPLNHTIYFTQATRGCPFRCNFCSITPVFGRRHRHRSVGAVLDEIQEMQRPTHQLLFFHDDNLTHNKPWIKELLEGMLSRGIRFPLGWHSQMRSDAARDKELVRLMKRTNMAAGTFGFESVNPDSLKAMDKGQSPDDVRNAIKTMKDIGAFVIGFFVFGTEHDNVKSIRNTAVFAREAGVDFAGFMPLTPFPGTPLYEQLDAEGRIFCKDWELYDVEHVLFWPKNMTPYELYTETLANYERFYRGRLGLSRLREIRAMLASKPVSPLGLLSGAALASWPLSKRYALRKELLSNRRYIQYLKKISRSPEPPSIPVGPGEFSGHELWKQDLLTNRIFARNISHRIVKTFPLEGIHDFLDRTPDREPSADGR